MKKLGFIILLFHIQHYFCFSQNTTDLNNTSMMEFNSRFLHKKLRVDIYLPPNYHTEKDQKYSVLYANDGQDMKAAHLSENLLNLYQNQEISKIIVVAIHADRDRIQDYGTAIMADYKHRGSKAKAFSMFILHELMPYIRSHFRTTGKAAYMGFSLGGLSAFDMVWANPQIFDCVGVFSGSFWWRKKAYEDGYDDYNDRIMHTIVRSSESQGYDLRFWLQTGTEDENADRNNNGIIDSIEDTLDLIKELEAKGYRKDKEIRYVEVQGGKHDQATWGQIMPDFLRWAFGKK